MPILVLNFGKFFIVVLGDFFAIFQNMNFGLAALDCLIIKLCVRLQKVIDHCEHYYDTISLPLLVIRVFVQCRDVPGAVGKPVGFDLLLVSQRYLDTKTPRLYLIKVM